MSGLQNIFFFVVAVTAVIEARSPQPIRGGDRAAMGEFPYQVSLRYRGQHICGGSILDEKHIITAAHCVMSPVKAPWTDLRVAAGSIFSFGGKTNAVNKVISHKNYDTTKATSPDDIAIIQLKEPLVFGKNVNKVELPKTDAVNGVDAVATGWGSDKPGPAGSTAGLMKINMKTLDHAQCEKRFHQIPLFPHQICTIGGVTRGVCQGDSGGPLVHNGELIGIVSFGIPCGVGYPDVYTKVFHYRDWIKETLASF